MFGDDGITAIAAALGKSKIWDLSVEMCSISVTGAKNLASALSTNQTIKVLYLHANPITVEGARLVLQSAMNNKVCEYVSINDHYESDSEVMKMMATLKTRSEANKR